MSKFQRDYQITIETNDGSFVVVQYPLTLEFNIVRNIFASANTGDFRILNLGAVTRNRIYKNKFQTNIFRSVVLKAGYDKQLPIIFNGNIKEAFSYKEQGSVEFVTEMSCYDGGFDISNSFSSFSLTSGATEDQVVDRLIKDLKNTERGTISTIGGEHLRGRTILGNTMDRLSEETGNAAFIDNGKVHVLRDSECLQGDILLLNSKTGLLGSPKRTGNLLIVELLFEPKLKVGQQVSLESQTERNYNGIYKVIGIQHTGIISGSVNGNCRTIAQLWFGPEPLEVISGRQ